MVMHGHVEDVEEHEARSAMDFQESPEALAVLAAEAGVGDASHQPCEQPDPLEQEEELTGEPTG